MNNSDKWSHASYNQIYQVSYLRIIYIYIKLSFPIEENSVIYEEL